MQYLISISLKKSVNVQAKNGYHSLTGIDYSGYAIELAKAIALDEHLDIQYKVCAVFSYI